MQETDNKPRTSPHALSIRTTPDGFSFCFTTAKGYILKDLKMPTKFDFPERFEDYVQSKGWAEKENLDVTIIDFANQFMVLPDKITDEEQIKTFFNFEFQHQEANQIFTVPLYDGKQIFCWEMLSSQDQYFEKLFPSLKIVSSAYLLANWTIRRASEVQYPIVVAHLYGKHMHLFAANAEKLLFANTFSIKEIQEIPYYLFRCMDQLSLDPLTSRCIICCETVSDEEILDMLSPYLKYIELAIFTHETDEPLQITLKKMNPYANR